MNENEVRQKWARKGFSFGIWTDPPGQVWEGYVHAQDELLMVVKGKVEIEMMGQKKIAEPGEEVFIPAEVVHSVRNLGNVSSRWLYGYRNS